MIFTKLKEFLFGKEGPNKVSSNLKTGKVKFFSKMGGYGFIHSQQLARDVFVHIKDAKDKIRGGDRVVFELEQNEKGLIARNVEVVSR